MIKILALINSSKQFGVAANAAAHASLGLASRLVAEAKQLPTKEWKEGPTLHPLVVDVPIEVKSADAETLRKCRMHAISKGLLFTDFTQTMTGDTYIEQLEKTKSTNEAELEYYCVVIAGSEEDLGDL
jgi:hypothetical protein